MINLEYLTASRTYLGGLLPEFLLTDMHMLVKLDLSHCSFVGPLPPIGDLMNSLRIVQVFFNLTIMTGGPPAQIEINVPL